MNLDALIYDHSTAVHRGDRIKHLEALVHAILRRHHPNGCEITEQSLLELGGTPLHLTTTENPQRRTWIVSSEQR